MRKQTQTLAQTRGGRRTFVCSPLSIANKQTNSRAELVDVGQARGEIATKERGGANIPSGVITPDTVPATLTDLGISRQRLHEARGEIARPDGYYAGNQWGVSEQDTPPPATLTTLLLEALT